MTASLMTCPLKCSRPSLKYVRPLATFGCNSLYRNAADLPNTDVITSGNSSNERKHFAN